MHIPYKPTKTFKMGTRHLSLLEQKKMQWAKEREEMAGLCAPWGPPEKTRPLRKRLVPNFPEETDEELLNRDYENSSVPLMKESPIEDTSVSITYSSIDNRGRTIQRERNEVDSRSPSLPPVSRNIQEDMRRSFYQGKEGINPRQEGFEGYLYYTDGHGLSKSSENFISNELDQRTKRKAFLSGDQMGDSGSLEKTSADQSPYSSSYQFRNSNLSIATEGDNTWREWGNMRGSGEEPRPRWGDRGINMGPPWNPAGPNPVGRTGDTLRPPEDYPTPGWVERGLSRMSGDGRGRGGSAELQRGDSGVRVIVSDEMGGTQRLRGSMNELQNLGYGSGDGNNEVSSQKNFDGHPVGMPYIGEMQSSTGPHRGGSTSIEGSRGERVIVVGRDVYNASEIVHNGRPYGYSGCISAPSNKSSGYKFKKNDDVTSSLPNLQCTNTHLRGQNVPIDPDVVVEREMRRLKAMELQKAIRQQLDERERRRVQEKEQRLREEREIEESSRKQQEIERMKKEDEERKQREKEEIENKKAELMREALEAAEQDAQKQRKKRSMRQHEEKLHEEEVNKLQSDSSNIKKTDEHVGNYIISSHHPIIAEGSPSVLSQSVQPDLDNVDYDLPSNFQLENNMQAQSRSPSLYEGNLTIRSGSSTVAPFKITLPETSVDCGHNEEGNENADPKQGGVLIVGRDVYLLPFVNTDILAPKLMNGSTYSLGGIDNIGNRLFNRDDQCDYRKEWIGSNTQFKSSKDVSTQTDPCSQGPLLLLLRMDDSQSGYEQRSSTDDSSIYESECKDGKEKPYSADAATTHSDCCFCHSTRSESQPSCSKSSGQDVQQRRPQQVDHRPKWGANRPSRKYTTQSEKDPHYACRTNTQKRPTQTRNKRDVADAATTEEGSEDLDQISKPQMKIKTKVEHSPSLPSQSCSNGTNRTHTPRTKRHVGKKSTKKTSESKKLDQYPDQHISQSPLPVLVPPRKEAPKRIQVVKPSLSIDQDSNGNTEQQYFESMNRTHITLYPTPMSMSSDAKHLLPPVLPVLQQGRLSPIRITPSPMPPIRISPSPTSSIRLCSTPMPNIKSSQSPVPPLRQTPMPPSPTPPVYHVPQNRNQSGSPPVPAVLAKMRREQAKSPPRQFSFISTAPDKEEKVIHSARKETRSSTPSLKPPTPGPNTSTLRNESKSPVVLVNPPVEASGTSIMKCSRPSSQADLDNKTLLITPRDDLSIASPSLNISCPSASSPTGDVSNALMLVNLSEDISIGSVTPNPLSSFIEIDDKRSYVLVTPSDEISVGIDCRSNLSVSRASQISAEAMPDGFWEDVVTSAQVITPRPDANSAFSFIEECVNDQKAGEDNSEDLKRTELLKTLEVVSTSHVPKDDPKIEEIRNDKSSPKDDKNKLEVCNVVVETKDAQGDGLGSKDKLETKKNNSDCLKLKDDQEAENISTDDLVLIEKEKADDIKYPSNGSKDGQKTEKVNSACLELKDIQKAEETNSNDLKQNIDIKDDQKTEQINSDDLENKGDQKADNTDSRISMNEEKSNGIKFESPVLKEEHEEKFPETHELVQDQEDKEKLDSIENKSVSTEPNMAELTLQKEDNKSETINEQTGDGDCLKEGESC